MVLWGQPEKRRDFLSNPSPSATVEEVAGDQDEDQLWAGSTLISQHAIGRAS
jgi:hypothetical protein